MINRICPDCNKSFEYEPPKGYPDNRKYCDVCKARRQKEWDAKQTGDMQNKDVIPEPQKPGLPVKSNPEIKAPTGEYQSLVYNKTLSANSYEVGKSGNRFKLYFETTEELQAKIKELKESGLMEEEVIKPEAFE